jgi:hypothetical protein
MHSFNALGTWGEIIRLVSLYCRHTAVTLIFNCYQAVRGEFGNQEAEEEDEGYHPQEGYRTWHFRYIAVGGVSYPRTLQGE